jgi:hypothetical protein
MYGHHTSSDELSSTQTKADSQGWATFWSKVKLVQVQDKKFGFGLKNTKVTFKSGSRQARSLNLMGAKVIQIKKYFKK